MVLAAVPDWVQYGTFGVAIAAVFGAAFAAWVSSGLSERSEHRRWKREVQFPAYVGVLSVLDAIVLRCTDLSRLQRRLMSLEDDDKNSELQKKIVREAQDLVATFPVETLHSKMAAAELVGHETVRSVLKSIPSAELDLIKERRTK